METLNEFLFKKRNKLGLNKTEFAEYLGISKVTLMNIESGEKVGSFVLNKISEALNVSVEKLCTLQGGIQKWVKN